jgi:4,5-dihydroxyphthalate decarboxylase
LAGSLLKAFTEAKGLVAAQAGETAALGSMLPWSYADAEATRELMGDDFWPYGIPDNQHVLRTFLGYLHDQQLTGRRWESAELFAPETHDAFLV